MSSTRRHIVVLECSTDDCETASVMPAALVDPDDDRAAYQAACRWRRSRWEDGWRWIGSGLTSCPSCPPLVVEDEHGVHVAGPGLRPEVSPAQ